jgi:hypothetical protein
MGFNKSLLTLNKNFNKNYQLPSERAYRNAKLKNHTFREEELRKRVFVSPPNI